METENELSVRIHYDWLNKCRTCKHWLGDRAETHKGKCGSLSSEFNGQETSTDGHCPEWDTYDLDTAMEVLNGEWDHIHNPNNQNIPL